MAGAASATDSVPGYVYEVEVEDSDGAGTRLIDPVVEIAKTLGSPGELRSYHHDGDPSFLLGVADPQGHSTQLHQQVLFPPLAAGTARSPLLHIELEALVRTLRDAEILAFGAIPARQINRRVEVKK